MIYLAGEPDDMWWNGEVQEVYLGADLIWKSGPTIEVYEVMLDYVRGDNVFHSLIDLSPPPGEVWEILVEGEITRAQSAAAPYFVVGDKSSESFPVGPVAFSGEITSTSSRVGMVTTSNQYGRQVDFTGTVTVMK